MGFVANIRGFFNGLGRGGKVRAINAMQNNPTQSNIPTRWSTGFMGPGAPMGTINMYPTGGSRWEDFNTEPRSFQYVANINATITPRAAYDLLPFSELKFWAENVPEVAECIRIITEEIKAFRPQIVDEQDNEITDPDLMWMIESPDRFNAWPVWLSRFLYNMLVYDAGAVHTPRDENNHITLARVIDGSTLFVLIDPSGEQPHPPAPAFQQIIYGVPYSYYNTHQIWYHPRHLRADAPYGRSPIEDSLITVQVLYNFWKTEAAWYTEGNIPEKMIAAPENWSDEQCFEYEDKFNARMAGNINERARLRVLPKGFTDVATKDISFNQDQYQAAANSVRMAFGIPRTEFGESPGTGLGGSGFLEAMQNVFYRMGIAPVKSYLEGFFNYVLKENGREKLRFNLAFPKESIDPGKEKQEALEQFTAGVITRDEYRQVINKKPLGGELGAFIANPPSASQSQPGGMDTGGDQQSRSPYLSQNGKIPVKRTIPVKGEGIPVNDDREDETIPVRKYDESDHPRDDDGKFSDKGGGGQAGGDSQKKVQDNKAPAPKQKRTTRDSEKLFKDTYESAGHSLNIKQEQLLQDYANSGYLEINDTLRGNNTLEPDDPIRKDIDREVGLIRQAIYDAPGLPENMTLYRGFGNQKLYQAVLKGSLEVGDSFTDKGFSSTSLSPMVAEYFADKNPIMLVIDAKEGSPGLCMNALGLGIPGEHEVLLPDNVKFEVTDIKRSGSTIVLKVRYQG